MMHRSWAVAAGLPVLLASIPAVAQTGSTHVDYLFVSPTSACTRISGGGIGPHTAQFSVEAWNAGPNAIKENRTGDDFALGVVPVEWATADTVFDAHSGLYALTESPDGPYGNNWNVVATVTQSIDLTGAQAATLEFWHRYEFVGNFDFGYVEVMSSTGWSIVLAVNGTLGEPDEFRPVTIDLAPFLGDTILFRFRVHTDLGNVGDGWSIDDVVVSVDDVDVFADDFESGLGNWAISSQWGLTIPTGLEQVGAIDQNGLFTASDQTGASYIRAIYDGTVVGRADVDVYAPDWVP